MLRGSARTEYGFCSSSTVLSAICRDRTGLSTSYQACRADSPCPSDRRPSLLQVGGDVEREKARAASTTWGRVCAAPGGRTRAVDCLQASTEPIERVVVDDAEQKVSSPRSLALTTLSPAHPSLEAANRALLDAQARLRPPGPTPAVHESRHGCPSRPHPLARSSARRQPLWQE